MVKRSTLAGIPGLTELLSFNDEEFSADEVFEEILKMALEKFEYYEPLVTTIKVHVDYSGRDHFPFTDNTAQVLSGIVGLDNHEMIPNTILGLSQYRSFGQGYLQKPIYENGKMYRGSTSGTNTYMIKGIFNRPLIIKYDSSRNITDDSWLCFMAEGRSEKWAMFMKQLLLSFLEYLYNIKSNMTIPDLPIEIFGALEVVKDKLDQELDVYYKETLSSGSLLT